ncbi:hypothetical protein MG293_006051 [Ovis ammon polii]|uniref:Uncharacterized protein n=1 Tax=Ovis ammon polii TaxID=230172 RepID=A0AAD4UB30_OVIAM|nr:hypothetical protein MG293_006051 [Ovis ammon polii]
MLLSTCALRLSQILRPQPGSVRGVGTTLPTSSPGSSASGGGSEQPPCSPGSPPAPPPRRAPAVCRMRRGPARAPVRLLPSFEAVAPAGPEQGGEVREGAGPRASAFPAPRRPPKGIGRWLQSGSPGAGPR